MTGHANADVRTWRFSGTRLVRNLIGLLPFVGLPVVMHLTGRADMLLYSFAVVGAGLLIFAVLFSAARYRVRTDASGLSVRGRLRKRTVGWGDIEDAAVRPGRGKAARFMGPGPFRELVLLTGGKRLVVSSLPLGEDSFEELVAEVRRRLAARAG